MINQYVQTHEGHLPVRVLQHNIIHQFENTNSKVIDEIRKLQKISGFKEQIAYCINRDKNNGVRLEGPFVLNDNLEINIQETFLAYLWCTCCSLIIHSYNLSEPANNYYSRLADMANMLISYAQSLITEYKDWDKSKLLNPECYEEKDKIIVEKTNDLFLYAFNFILCHEFCHIKCGHSSKYHKLTDEGKKELEIEADNSAIEMLIHEQNNHEIMKVNVGIVVALCSFLLSKKSVKNIRHLDTDCRISEALNQLQVDDNDTSWLIACASINILQELHAINLFWEETNSFKELFLSLSRQLE